MGLELLGAGKAKGLSVPVQVLVEQNKLLQYKYNPKKKVDCRETEQDKEIELLQEQWRGRKWCGQNTGGF